MRSGPWWDKHIASDWECVGPPSRPSPSELQVFDNYLANLPRHSKVMILGSTSELRDMCFLKHLQTLVVDYDTDTFNVLGGHLRHPDSADFHDCDWRDMSFANEFDAVVGDLALNMVPISDQDKVLSNIATSLVPGGLFVHRSWVLLPKEQAQPTALEQILSRHSPSCSNHFYSLAMALITHFRSVDASIDFQIVLEALRKAHEREQVDTELLKEFEGSWNNYHLLNWIPIVEQHDTSMRKYLQYVATRYGTDPYHESCPIYAMRKPLRNSHA